MRGAEVLGHAGGARRLYPVPEDTTFIAEKDSWTLRSAATRCR